jgi:hypothetical protein
LNDLSIVFDRAESQLFQSALVEIGRSQVDNSRGSSNATLYPAIIIDLSECHGACRQNTRWCESRGYDSGWLIFYGTELPWLRLLDYASNDVAFVRAAKRLIVEGLPAWLFLLILKIFIE